MYAVGEEYHGRDTCTATMGLGNLATWIRQERVSGVCKSFRQEEPSSGLKDFFFFLRQGQFGWITRTAKNDNTLQYSRKIRKGTQDPWK